MNKRILVYIQIALVILTLAGSVYVAITPANSMLNWYNGDDAFYYYKVAQNILTGHGSTFDQINLSNGYHPLWMLVCLGVFWLSRFNLILPLRVLVIVSGLFNAATALLLFRFLKRFIRPGAALAGALIWGLYPPIFDSIITHGMESVISAFFIVLLLSMSAKYLDEFKENEKSYRKLIWLGSIGALTILARLDNLFVVGVIGIFLLLKIRKIPVMAAFDILVISFSVYITWIIRLGSEGVIQNTYTIYPMLVLSVLIKPIFLYFAGCYTSRKTLTRIMVIVRVTLALIAAFVVEYISLILLFKIDIIKMFSNSIIAIDAVISLFFVLLVHLFLIKSVQPSNKNPFSALGIWVKNHWKTTVVEGLSYGSPIVVLVGAYMIFNELTFGTFTPVSGQIKHWWSSLTNTVYSHPNTLISVLGLSTSAGNGPWSLVTSELYIAAAAITKLIKGFNTEIIFGLFIFVALILFLLLMRAEKRRLTGKFFNLMIPAILIGSIIHITYYTATGYTHTRIWYWAAEMITVVGIGSLVLDGIFSWVDKLKSKIKVSPILVGLIAVFLIIEFVQYITVLSPYSVLKENQSAYLEETKQVEFYTQPGSKIGMTGGGLVAYFIQDRTIVNLDGLINSKEYFNAMKSGKATQFLDKIPLNYVFGKPYTLLESDPYKDILKNRLDEIGFIRGGDNFTLYKYVFNK